MKSVKVTKYNETLQLVDESLPALKGTDCLIQVTSSGLCHSDLHIYEGHFDLGGGEKIDMSSKLPLPITLGHEVAGIVRQIGPDLNPEDPENKNLVGKKVIIYPWHQGQGIQRPGGFSTHIVAQKTDLVPCDGIPDEQAGPLACSGLTSYSALKKAARALQGPGVAKRRVLIIGAGGVGLQAVSLCRSVLSGQSPIIADIDDSKLEQARLLFDATATGAEGDAELSLETINSRVLPDAIKRVLELTEGKGPDVVLDFVGSTATVALGIKSLGVRLHRGFLDGGNSNGKLILVGLFGGSFPLPLPLIPIQNLTIEGSYVGSLSELKELVELRRKFPLSNFPVSLTQFNEENVIDSVQKLKNGKVVGRVVFTYSHL